MVTPTKLKLCIYILGTTNLIMFKRSLVPFLRISGNAASDKNIKDGVCAQIEKNFAKAKWKVSFVLYHNLFQMLDKMIILHSSSSLQHTEFGSGLNYICFLCASC